MARRLITAEDVRKAAAEGKKAMACPQEECIVTPMARDEAASLGILFREEPSRSSPTIQSAAPEPQTVGDEAIVRQVCDLIRERLPSTADAQHLEKLVRNAVAARLGASKTEPRVSSGRPETRAGGICCISGRRLIEGSNGPVPVDEKVLVAEAIGREQDARLAGGFMAWEKASFTRVVEFPEIGVVLEGELHLSAGGQTLIAKPGDMLYFPKGANVAYSTPSSVKLACVNCIP